MTTPFVRHSQTSLDAARELQGKTTKLALVYKEIVCRGKEGATDEELQVDLGMSPNTERPRRVELVRGGFVVDSGMVRKTQASRYAVVWIRAPGAGDQGTLGLELPKKRGSGFATDSGEYEW
jgi:hypothetical protein